MHILIWIYRPSPADRGRGSGASRPPAARSSQPGFADPAELFINQIGVFTPPGIAAFQDDPVVVALEAGDDELMTLPVVSKGDPP